MKNIIKNTAILTVITLVAGVLLGLVYEVTKEPIALAKEKAKNEAYQTVMKDADTFDAEVVLKEKKVSKLLAEKGITGCNVDEVVAAKTNDEIIGYIFTTTTSEGYGGDIQISVGIANDGTVTGVEILSISETAGLGMNADTPEFKAQYADKKVDAFAVTKTGAAADNEIDAISGATITSNAVTNAVNTSVACFQEWLGGSVNE